MNTFILASASPRRTELLHLAGIKHIVIPSDCEESTVETEPSRIVEDLSCQKAEDVFATYQQTHPDEEFIVLGSDTIVSCHGEILGKPEDRKDAERMIRLLQDQMHQVFSGVTLLKWMHGKKSKKTFHVKSDVCVYPMTDAEIEAYISTPEPYDKAGSYGIQGSFAVYIKEIRGDYNNIVGLPIARIHQELKSFSFFIPF